MNTSRPQILYLTHNYPHAKSYGAQLRTLNIARLLKRCGDVRLVLLPLADSERVDMEKTEEEFALGAILPVNMRSTIKGVRNRLLHEFDPWFCNTHGRTLRRNDVARISSLIAEHDVVWIYNVAVANTTGISHWPHSILDVDDILSQYHRSALTCTKTPLERAMTLRQLWLWKRREAVLLKRFSILAVSSEADRQYLGGGNRIHTIPNGFECPETKPKRSPAVPPRIGFIGTVDYPPNREGINWFIESIWPAIRKHHLTVRLRLVGAGTESLDTHSDSHIDRLGWIEDTTSEIETWSLTIVPIRVGGGTRIKVVEAFSRQCPAVSTTVGAFGYDVTSGQEILLADGAEEFANACLALLLDSRLGRQLASRAWQKYIEHWTWNAIGPSVSAAVEHCLALSRGTRSTPNMAVQTVSANSEK